MDLSRITFDPGIMGGRPCIRGMRMPVATIVRMVASGMTTPEIIDAHPELVAEDITAALAYAASLAEGRVLPLRPTGS